MPSIVHISAAGFELYLEGNAGSAEVSLSVEEIAEGLTHVNFSFRSPQPTRPSSLRLVWHLPLAGIHLRWFPGSGTDRTLLAEWRARRVCDSRNTLNAPVYALFDSADRNSLTFALSDALNATRLAAGVVEETASVKCEVTLFAESSAPLVAYDVTLRLDTRPVPWHKTLADTSDWWASMPSCAPAPVPDHARLPMYSSWYSFHQRLSPTAILEQCLTAKGLGMESIIVDDGWQTDDNSRGYAFCGDWLVTKSKFPAFAAHVKSVHDAGMKYILWFSVPFVGIHSKAYARFRDKVLNPASTDGWFVLDPRFREVREYLVGLYEKTVVEYGLDGLKLDFVDTFELTPETRDSFGGGRDIDSVPEAVDRLLTDTMSSLRAINPNILIEFRQSYIGPMMRKYGNMFRAGDVPGDYHGNRISTVDIRLISGSTPAHSDMVMWHPQDSVESAAMQLIHTLFSVPQVSMLLDRIPTEHVEMLRFYLAFWRQHRDVLLDGIFEPAGPGMLYPVVIARNEAKLVAAVYADAPVRMASGAPATLIFVNGTFVDRLIVDLSEPVGEKTLTVLSCRGEKLRRETVRLAAGVNVVAVPPAGVAVIE